MDEQPNADAPPSPAAPPQNWARAVMWIGIVFVLVMGAVLVFRSCQKLPGDVIDKTSTAIERTSHALTGLAAAFKRGTVTTSFISYATTLHPAQNFQFATLKEMELFSRSDTKTFGIITLPEVVVEARAPVEYTYFVDMNGKWNFELKDSALYVMAPRIQYNQPAIDASKIEYEVRKGTFRTDEVLNDLKRSLTMLSRMRARENIPLVRETARKQIAEFVEVWLAKSFTNGTNYPVKVYFPGETLPNTLSFTNAPAQ